MIIAGIDMGIQNTKVVIMRDNAVVGRGKASTGGMDRPEQAKKAYDDALKSAGIDAKDVSKVIATGKGKFDIPFADDTYTETVAAMRAAQYYFPDATGVMSAGADETLAATVGSNRLIGEFVLNQKCCAGLGTFISYLARKLGKTIEQAAAVDCPDCGTMNDGCVVFAELDALSMMNDGAAPDEIIATALGAVATRAATVLADLTASPGDRVVLLGGLAKSPAFVAALEKSVGLKLLIPEDPEFGGAVGAAICGEKGLM